MTDPKYIEPGKEDFFIAVVGVFTNNQIQHALYNIAVARKLLSQPTTPVIYKYPMRWKWLVARLTMAIKPKQRRIEDASLYRLKCYGR